MLEWMFSKPLEVGTRAPEFSLSDQDGRTVTLAGLRGRNVILVFYPADDTTVCTKQLCEFRDQWEQAQAKNAVVVGVNPAGTGRHSKFRDRYKLPFPLLVDAGQKMGKAYNAAGGLAPKRTVYLIDPDGVIRYARRGKPDPAEVLASAK